MSDDQTRPQRVPAPTRRTGSGPPAGAAEGSREDLDYPEVSQTYWSAGPGSGDTLDRGAGPTTRTAHGARDIGADDLGPVTSGDAANIGGPRNTPDNHLEPGGGATLAGNIGDAGADAGDGSIDATDDTTVTGDPDVSPAARADAKRHGPR